MKSRDLLQLVDNLQQARKIHNLQHVCSICNCVGYAPLFGTVIDKCQKAHYMTVKSVDVSLAFATTNIDRLGFTKHTVFIKHSQQGLITSK